MPDPKPTQFILRIASGNEGFLTHEYAQRRTHKKSKLGCTSCKSRHSKCDEVKPICGRCRRNRWKCIYKAPSLSPPKVHQESEIRVPILHPLKAAFVDCSDSELTLLHHYSEALAHKLLPYFKWKTVPGEMLQKADQHVGVLNAILAISSLHQRQIFTNQDRPQSESVYALKAVQSLQRSLQNDWWGPLDSTLTMTILLNLLSFADVDPVETYVPLMARPRDRRFHWVGVQLGLRPLLIQLMAKQIHARNCDSTWLSAFEGVFPIISDIFDHRDGDVGIPPEWAELLKIDEHSSCATHPYLRVIRRLCHITEYTTDEKESNRNTCQLRDAQFVEGLTPEFLSLMQDLDPRALVLFAQWLGILCDRGLWWSKLRARTECQAICLHIDENATAYMKWLERPAGACGYMSLRKPAEDAKDLATP